VQCVIKDKSEWN
jgi:hypothetical protein